MSYILKLKCTKFDIGWGHGGAYSAPPDLLAGFEGPTSKGREERAGEEDRKGEGREGREKGSEGIGEGEGGKENGDRPPTIFDLKVALEFGMQ